MYGNHFGFTGQAFQLTPDPAFLFFSRGHARAAAYLQYGLHRAEGFIVITGDVGAGKTTLLRSLLEHLDRSKIVPTQIVSTRVNADDLLRLVALGFGVRNAESNKATLLDLIEVHLTRLHAEGKRALLVVDEAQNLSAGAVEELRMLSNFQIGAQPLLQSFLVGQPEFRAIMQRAEMSQLRQRIIATYHLGPMDQAETQSYIEFRLTKVGWTGNPAFDSEAFSEIFAASGGIPRRINSLCDRLLLAASLDAKQEIKGADISAVLTELSQDFESGLNAESFVHENPARSSDLLEIANEHREVALRLSLLEARMKLLESTCLAIHRILSQSDGSPASRQNATIKVA